MSWNLSTGLQKALLAQQPAAGTYIIATTISFGDGDGTGSTDTINDSGSGFGSFAVDDFVLILGGTNHNILAKVLTKTNAKLEVAAGTFAAMSAGTAVAVAEITSGALTQILKNGTIVGYSGVRPSTGADAAESGTKLIEFTKNGNAFVGGASANGINLSNISAATAQIAVDPSTGIAEVIRGLGLENGTLGYVRWYANAKTTGSSTSAIRMDGVVEVSGGDVNISTGKTIVASVPSEITSISFTATGA